MNIEFIGKFYDNHSLSLVNRNIVSELSKNTDLTIRVTPLDAYNPDCKVDKSIIAKLKELELVDFEYPDIQIRHSYPPIWLWPVDNRTKVIFIQPWEFNKAPFEWQYKFETFADAVIVPSTYIKTTFLNGGLNPNNIFVVGNGYDSSIFNLDKEAIINAPKEINKDKFNFIYVGNTQWRKGLDILLHSWAKSFKKHDNARLIIKDNPAIYGTSSILNDIVKLQYKTNCADITYLSDNYSDEDMAAIFKSCQVIVHPYRAEGFGMHIQEAVACGCYPIISAEGPTEDFIPKDIGARIAVQNKYINIADSQVFAMKAGDAMTQMGSHTLVKEPIAASLEKEMQSIYYSHNRDKLLQKTKEFSNTNTWEKITNDYYNILKQVNTKTVNRKVI